jgi:hypothetical protein
MAAKSAHRAGDQSPPDPPPNPPSPLPATAIVLTPAFKLIFFSVLGLTILSLVGNFLAVLVPNQTEEVKRLAETCSTTWKLGFGAIVGLIGGKVL